VVCFRHGRITPGGRAAGTHWAPEKRREKSLALTANGTLISGCPVRSLISLSTELPRLFPERIKLKRPVQLCLLLPQRRIELTSDRILR
jgi:hypothetical protein